MAREQLIVRNKQLQTAVSGLAASTVTRALPDLEGLSQLEAGGAVRRIANGAIARFGDVATTTAVQSYQALRGEVPTALAGSFTPETLRIDPVSRSEGLIGASMTKYAQGAFVEAQALLAVTVSREVANIYRETMVRNSEIDRVAVGYQRVASANACAFCLTVALNQYTSFPDSGGYHNDCNCDAVPIFKEQSAYRPDYYDDFQSIYEQGRADSGSSDAEEIFAAIRQATGRN